MVKPEAVQNALAGKKVLDVGCGNNKTPNAVGLDANPRTQADVTHDLNCYPLPFADDTFDAIVCNHVIEHVDDLVKLMEELHRIGKPRARVTGVTPHYSNRCSFLDPTHKHHLSARVFDLFTPPRDLKLGPIYRWVNAVLEIEHEQLKFYAESRFRVVRLQLVFSRLFRLVGIEYLANRHIDLYEFYFAGLFPARDILFELEILK